MQYFLMNLAVHVLSFTLSFWALSCVRFETFTNVRKPGQVRLLLLLLSLGLGYLVAQLFACYFRIQRTVEALFIDRKGPTADT